MSETINIYCDESCHLRNDKSKVMVLGAVTCPNENKRKIFEEIRAIKIKHKLDRDFEIKWTKVSNAKIDFYLDLINYFLNNENLCFRALIIPNKLIINAMTKTDWEIFYYRMYYQLLNNLINPNFTYQIYLDIKDTKGSEKRRKLFEILQTIKQKTLFSKDFKLKTIQAIASHEVELIQLTDLLLGAICYANRGLITSSGKLQLIEKLKMETGYPLTETTFLSDSKFNLFKINLDKSWRL